MIRDRAERLEKTSKKNKEYKKKGEIKHKCKKINKIFKEIPKNEALRKEEKSELEKVREMIWKKWRGRKIY